MFVKGTQNRSQQIFGTFPLWGGPSHLSTRSESLSSLRKTNLVLFLIDVWPKRCGLTL